MSLANRLTELSGSPANAPHVIVRALAGTGKTTTLIEGLKKLKGMEPGITPSPQQAKVWEYLCMSGPMDSACFVAFNKSIATELQNRVPTGVEACTMHSLGFAAVRKHLQSGKRTLQVTEYRVQDIIADILGKDIRDLRKESFEMIKATERLVSLCKMNLVDAGGYYEAGLGGELEEALDDLASYYDVDLNGCRTRVYNLVPQVLLRCKDVSRDGRIDYDDMIWLPVALQLPLMKYDLLLVDEAQDLNRCQQALAKMAGRRLVFCGDANQAIYGFAGADCESLDRLYEELDHSSAGCVKLPLTVTRRCAKLVVEEAKKMVPDFEAHESNSEGAILRMSFKGTPTVHKMTLKSTELGMVGELSNGEVVSDLKSYPYHDVTNSGDMILCRVNAPLVSECFRFIRSGRKATIQGRDIGQGLISTIKKMKAETVADLCCKLSDWVEIEVEKENRKRNPSEARIIGIQDRYDCLIAFTEGAACIDDVVSDINEMFSDDQVGIKLSSIHKAKGLEAKRVFLLEPKGATVPHPMAKSDWERKQEWNLRYVAVTRAIETLVYVVE